MSEKTESKVELNWGDENDGGYNIGCFFCLILIFAPTIIFVFDDNFY